MSHDKRKTPRSSRQVQNTLGFGGHGWSTIEKLVFGLLAVIGIGIVGILIGLALIPPSKPTQLGTLAQTLATLGVLVTAVIMWISVQGIRRQVDEQRSQWEREREAAAKPLLTYSEAWFGGHERDLTMNFTNVGRPLTGISGTLLLLELSQAEDEWGKGRFPGGSTVVGVIHPSGKVSQGGSQKDIQNGEDVHIRFHASSVTNAGTEFTLVVEYWDLEGRSYRAAWGFMTQGENPDGLRADLRNQTPARRFVAKDRR